jgi:hypothetical protein
MWALTGRMLMPAFGSFAAVTLAPEAPAAADTTLVAMVIAFEDPGYATDGLKLCFRNDLSHRLGTISRHHSSVGAGSNFLRPLALLVHVQITALLTSPLA